MRRLNLGLTLLLLVAMILIVAPTVVFWVLWGFKAVAAHWAWVAFLIGLMFLGVLLVFGRAPQSGRPEVLSSSQGLRFRLGMLSFGLVAAILVFAPTVVFGYIFGMTAVLAHWAAVGVLAAMTLSGLYLIFTDKSRARQHP
jgi:hypothetical protein